MQTQKFFSNIMAGMNYIWWDDDDVHFVLDQHPRLDFHSARKLQQQFTDRNVTPLLTTSLCSFFLMLHT
jgi:hypothetical protein